MKEKNISTMKTHIIDKMKTTTIILIIFLSSCGIVGVTFNNKKKCNENLLKTMDSYSYSQVKDSLNGNSIKHYNDLNIKFEISRFNNTCHIYLKNEEILILDQGKYCSLRQVFNDSIFVLSVYKYPCNFADPFNFKRDSVFFIDLHNYKLSFISLKNIYLAKSKEYLKPFYNNYDGSSLIKYCSIESIDTKENMLKLFNSDHSILEFETNPIKKPYKIN